MTVVIGGEDHWTFNANDPIGSVDGRRCDEIDNGLHDGVEK